MKVIIQIPCFNEEENIKTTIDSIRKATNGYPADIKLLIIDDGSTDETLNIARECGVEHILELPSNQGLAHAFQKGLDTSLDLGAEIILNTDGDGQYPAEMIPVLISEILKGSCDVVIGDRETNLVKDFSFQKRIFQKLGSKTASTLCGIEISDAASGFRGYTREAAAWLQITSSYTYTLESLVQLSQGNYRVVNIPTGRNTVNRPSRLFKSPYEYILKNGSTLLRIWIQYRPMRFFGALSFSSLLISTGLAVPFFVSRIGQNVNQHVQLVIFSSGFFILSCIFFMFGILGDAIRAHRLISQKTLQIVKLK